MPQQAHSPLLKVSSVLWIVWGLVHTALLLGALSELGYFSAVSSSAYTASVDFGHYGYAISGTLLAMVLAAAAFSSHLRGMRSAAQA